MSMQQKDISEQHIPLIEGRWLLWRWVALRGSGFPIQKIGLLSSPEAAQAADWYLEAEAHAEETRQSLLAALRSALQELRISGQWEQSPQRRQLLKGISSVNKGKLPKERFPFALEVEAALEQWQLALAEMQQLHDKALRVFEQELAATTVALLDLVRDHRFIEAVLWQNRQAYRSGILPLLEQQKQATLKRNVQYRNRELLLVRYLQRYYTKNDSIGYFGPVGWATLESASSTITVQPGKSLLATRNVSFEQWMVDELVEHLNQRPALRPWLPLFQLPTCRLDGRVMYLGDQQLSLPEAQTDLLQTVLVLCDGSLPACDIVAQLIADPAVPLSEEHEVYALLDSLATTGVISWKLDLPFLPDPTGELRLLFERVRDEAVREPVLQLLDQFEQRRLAVAKAVGDPSRLDEELGNLESLFTEVTGEAAVRMEGKAYGGRTLIYEDCRRDISITIGDELIQSFRAPLALLLTSARWLTYEIVGAYRREFLRVYHELVEHLRTRQIRLPVFWQRLQGLLFDERSELLTSVVEEFQRRWATLLHVDEHQRWVSYRSDELRERVETLFFAPKPGWSNARYHCPDIMLAAKSVEAIQRGEFTPVLGEIHIASNTLQNSMFVMQHPDPEQLIAAMSSDMPERRLVPMESRYWPPLTRRIHNQLVLPHDLHLLMNRDTVWWTNRAETLPIGALVVEETGEGLYVHTGAGQQFDLVEVVSAALSLISVNCFVLLAHRAHAPRLSIDRLVVCREAWTFDGRALSHVFYRDEGQQFFETRRWARQHGMPRYVFLRVSTERKPIFVDFDSRLLVQLLNRTIHQSCEGADQVHVSVTEMLPAVDEVWLPDAEGNRYTSELRLVAVDQSGSGIEEDWGIL